MKHFKPPTLLIFFLTLLFSFLPAQGESNLTIDFSERFRVVGWDQAVTLHHINEDGPVFTRNRTSLGLRWNPSENFEVYFKATNEFRIYIDPKRDFNIHEVFIDNLYLKIKNIFKLPVTLTLGRQNIFLGEGFVVLDGSTYDGSRSAYFDAFRADLNLKNGGKISAFSLFAQKSEDILPILNDMDQLMNESDIRGTGIYYQGKLKNGGIDLYFLNKETDINEDRTWALIVNTVGTKFNLKMKGSLQLTTEAAYQYGSSKGIPVRSYGGHFHLDKVLDNKTFKKVTFGGIFLSGEDSCKCKVTAWHPPFSRWPKWSESYIYTLINEGGIAYWSNYSSLYISLVSRLFDKGFLKTTLTFLSSPQKDLSPGFPGGEGRYRGTLLINKLNFFLTKHLSGHFLWEHFRPGNYYFSGAKSYNWIRFELMYKTKSRRR